MIASLISIDDVWKSGAFWLCVGYAFKIKLKKEIQKMKVSQVGAHSITPMTTESPSSRVSSLIPAPNMKGSFLHSHAPAKYRSRQLHQIHVRRSSVFVSSTLRACCKNAWMWNLSSINVSRQSKVQVRAVGLKVLFGITFQRVVGLYIFFPFLWFNL